jgi:thiosulfate/3-mercaptopyruvate sulfurtransferase
MSMLLLTILAAGVIGGLDHNVVTPAWLEENLDDPYVVVVEIGSSSVSANQPHIPGARFVPIESIVKQGGWPPDELPPVDQLRQAFENAGVGDEGRIILYSAVPLYTTRAWFTLDYLGQADRTAILDGGFARWQLEKRPVAQKRIPHMAKTFTPFPDATRLVSLADVQDAVDRGAVLIDARSAYEYHGLRRGGGVVRRGHIPGAECQPWKSNLAKNGSFLSPAALRAKYEKLIANDDARVIVYCRTGMEASMPYFVLRSLGYNVALHDGSFAEWSRDESLPVAKLSTRR